MMQSIERHVLNSAETTRMEFQTVDNEILEDDELLRASYLLWFPLPSLLPLGAILSAQWQNSNSASIEKHACCLRLLITNSMFMKERNGPSENATHKVACLFVIRLVFVFKLVVGRFPYIWQVKNLVIHLGCVSLLHSQEKNISNL